MRVLLVNGALGFNLYYDYLTELNQLGSPDSKVKGSMISWIQDVDHTSDNKTREYNKFLNP